MKDTSDALSTVLKRLRLTTGLFTEAEYCGTWAIDTSGERAATFHLVQSGDCWLRLPGEPPRRLRPGDFVLFPRDAKHVLASADELPDDIVVNAPPIPDGSTPTQMLCGFIEFESDAHWPIMDELPDAVVIDLAQSALGDSKAVLSLLIKEGTSDHAGRAAVIDQLIHILLIHVLRSYMAKQKGKSGMLAALGDPRVGRVLNLVHAQPERHWNVARLASEAGMSRASFSNRFGALVGDTPMGYVTRWRMQVAIDLLTTTDASIAHIAELVGYSSEPAFRNAFRKSVGRPPGAVRRSSQPAS